MGAVFKKQLPEFSQLLSKFNVSLDMFVIHCHLEKEKGPSEQPFNASTNRTTARLLNATSYLFNYH